MPFQLCPREIKNSDVVKKTFFENVFCLTNKFYDDYKYKILTFLGVSFIIKQVNRADIVRSNYQKLLPVLKSHNGKFKVLFLVSEIAKWKTQSLYDLMLQDERFEPVIALTIAAEQHLLSDELKHKILRSNYQYFKAKNMECVYAYDFENNKTISLEVFTPQIVFYQQPWNISVNQNVDAVSRYAMTCYVPYFVPNYGGLAVDCSSFHKLLNKYYVTNEQWAKIFNDYCKDIVGEILGLGHTMLDAFHLNRVNGESKNYVIYAPHWSIADKNNEVIEVFSTFDWNGKEILEYAKCHPEINWVFKPHPLLKFTLKKIGKMSDEEIENYYNEWEKIGICCYDSDYVDLFLNSKALITDCGSFLVEYFVTGKPVIHLISDKTSVVPLPPSKVIFDTYYKVHNLDELYSTLDEVIINNQDERKNERLDLLKELKLLDNYAAKNIMEDLKSTLGLV